MYLKDVVGNTDTIERLKVIAQDGNMPHIIISVSGVVSVMLFLSSLAFSPPSSFPV